ncbi:hypothetical protein GIB67_032938 [Kingdonia uniflora]|uniref:TEX10-like TPR repeats domain-containing protein n=1 Tax=Kingdonia uniflora TaxID=39325 RepID=A0A7J7MYG6_9MAGN|nr:hypothetical protein GIB67_032938 [Kingdonia uniflora]
MSSLDAFFSDAIYSSYILLGDVQDLVHNIKPLMHVALFIFAVAPSMVKKLEDLMPVLFNCFQELAPSVCLMPQVDEQSLECMSFVLQSIDLAVKFFVYGIDRRLSGFEVSGPCMHKKPDGGVWGETVMPMLLKKLEEVFPVGSVNHHTEKVDDRYNVLNVGIVMIFLHFGEWIYTPTILMEKFMQFIESMLSGQIFSTKKYNKALRKEYLVSLLPFIPRLLSQAASSWKSGLLQVFTSAFKGCRPESSLCLAFLSAIEEMLLPSHRHGTLFIDASDLELIGHQIAWIQELPDFLVRLGNDHPSSSKACNLYVTLLCQAVLQLQLRLGQCAPMSTSLASEYDSTQYSLREFYCTFLDGEGEGIRYGPFVKLPKDCQELAVSCLYYFSNLDPLFLKTLACCCLCKDLETFTLFRIIEVLQASYKSGHIQIADHISFFITILAHFKVSPEKSSPGTENEGKNSTHKTFKAITSIICSCVSQMGDNALVHQMIHKTILYEMSLVPTLENACAMLRMLVLLDFGPTRLLDDNIISLSNSLWSYLMDAAYYSPELSEVSTSCNQMEIYEYLLLPCLILFDRSDRLLTLVLNLMGSSIVETNSVASSLHDTQNDCARSRSIEAIASTLIFMHKEVKIQRILSSHKSEIGEILHNIFCLQSSKELSITLDERHKVKLAFNHLKTTTSRLHGWSCDDFRTS